MILDICEWCKVGLVHQYVRVNKTTYGLCLECYELEKKRRQFPSKL